MTNIERKIPNTVEIKVEERIPKYSVDFMGKFMYINSQKYILCSIMNTKVGIRYGKEKKKKNS